MGSPREDGGAPLDNAFISRPNQRAAGTITALCLLTVLSSWAWELHRRGSGIDVEQPATRLSSVPLQLDINRADWPELTVLPGISETLARRIVDHRSERGPFATLDELREVSGIGPRSLARIAPYLIPLADAAPHGEAGEVAVTP